MQAKSMNWFEREFSRETVEIVAKYAPAMTPIAPASMAVAGLFAGLYSAYGYFAALPAAVSGLGMEGTGYLASHLLIKSIRNKDFGLGALSVVFLGAYATFSAFAMHNMENAGAFQAFVALSIVTYLAAGAYTYDNIRQHEQIETRRRELEDERQRIELDKLKADNENAARMAAAQIEQAKNETDARLRELELQIEKQRTKQVKFTNTAAPVRPVREIKDEQPNTPRGRQLDAARLELVREYLKATPAASVRDVCRECNISSTDTAARYMKAA